MRSIYVVVQTVGFNPCPNATFIPMTPKIQFLFAVVAIFDCTIRPVASVMHVLQVLRVGEPCDDGQDLVAASLRPRTADVQPVGIARVDGLYDFPSRLLVFVSDRLVEQFQFPAQDFVRPFPILGGRVRRRPWRTP